jgi:pSer/pThr/pTyr-binding forkhead associated (FHA) protein
MNEIIVLVLRIVMLAILYIFIIWIFVTIWKSLKMLNKPYDMLLVPEITLSSQLPDGISERSFRMSPISMGRDPSSDLVLDHPTVSANHSQIYFKSNQWWIKDNQSTNGSKVNQVKVKEPMVLTSGDEIHCGHISITVSISK